jgi:hypothetical protein
MVWRFAEWEEGLSWVEDLVFLGAREILFRGSLWGWGCGTTLPDFLSPFSSLYFRWPPVEREELLWILYGRRKGP